MRKGKKIEETKKVKVVAIILVLLASLASIIMVSNLAKKEVQYSPLEIKNDAPLSNSPISNEPNEIWVIFGSFIKDEKNLDRVTLWQYENEEAKLIRYDLLKGDLIGIGDLFVLITKIDQDMQEVEFKITDKKTSSSWEDKFKGQSEQKIDLLRNKI